MQIHVDILMILGDPMLAAGYIEKAIKSSSLTLPVGFHASLGECYRVLGRYDDAISQFKLELMIHPGQEIALYNLAITYQQMMDWSSAIKLFRSINHPQTLHEDYTSYNLSRPSKIHECDLVQALEPVQGKTQTGTALLFCMDTILRRLMMLFHW